MWELWNPVMAALCTPLRETPTMPASSSVMLWEIGGYWGMEHFQNNGAAGGLDLRHCNCVLATASGVVFRMQIHA